MQFHPMILDYVMLGGVLLLSICIDFLGHKGDQEMPFGVAVSWFIFWVLVALGLGAYFYEVHGVQAMSLYFSGYALEKSLSIDNLMVMMVIFNSFGITESGAKHKVLLWGIGGALLFRAIFVLAGTALFNLHWSIQVLFGIIVAASAISIFKGDSDEEVDYSKHWAVKPLSKWFDVTTKLNGDKFTFKGKLTPLFVCMVVIELSDVMFSFDSVPAVIGVTKEPLLVYAAMIMAILGLRSLFFVLESLMKYLVHLDKAVGVVLIFVGAKLVAGAFGYHIHADVSLYVVLGLLALGIVSSLVFPEKIK